MGGDVLKMYIFSTIITLNATIPMWELGSFI